MPCKFVFLGEQVQCVKSAPSTIQLLNTPLQDGYSDPQLFRLNIVLLDVVLRQGFS